MSSDVEGPDGGDWMANFSPSAAAANAGSVVARYTGEPRPADLKLKRLAETVKRLTTLAHADRFDPEADLAKVLSRIEAYDRVAAEIDELLWGEPSPAEVEWRVTVRILNAPERLQDVYSVPGQGIEAHDLAASMFERYGLVRFPAEVLMQWRVPGRLWRLYEAVITSTDIHGRPVTSHVGYVPVSDVHHGPRPSGYDAPTHIAFPDA